ncbi:hypothetical protein FA95DRAFT_421436 [Auriscalpium vulgare]|uniref:Uncharacterized protein n=1 Tax=Auriscalpium vulgare TaxID=40419 RepID=A0ACB8S3V4_9AGAM|nr:hypothetical protein FA95DRAFT_421436 [Auriscalpium vulgare]
MTPYYGFASHHWPRFGGYHHYGGPRRIIWFALGAVAATVWARTRDSHVFGGCDTRRVRWESENGWRRREEAGAAIVAAPAAAAEVVSGREPQREVVYRAAPQSPEQGVSWEAEREKVRELGRSAGETVSELSEATIDSMLAGLQGLKSVSPGLSVSGVMYDTDFSWDAALGGTAQ